MSAISKDSLPAARIIITVSGDDLTIRVSSNDAPTFKKVKVALWM